MARYRIDNQPEPIDWEGKGEVARAVRNAKNLLMLRQGELPYDRLRGFDQAVYDLPIGEMRARLMPEIDMTLMWEPDAEAVSADCKILPGGAALVEAVIEIGIEEGR